MYSTGSLLLPVLLLSPLSPAAGQERNRDVALKHISIYQQAGAYCAWPSITRAASGDLLVLFTRTEEHLGPDGRILLTRSTDNGKSWHPPVVVYDTPLDDRESGITTLSNGSILAHIWSTRHTKRSYESLPSGSYDERTLQKWIQVVESAKYREAAVHQGAWESVSTDGGKSWSRPRRGHDSVHGGIELADGSLLVASYRKGEGKILLFAATRVGEPWRQIAAIHPPAPGSFGIGEPHLLRLRSGRIIMMIRATAIPYDDQDPRCVLWETYSDDGGKSWRDPFPTPLWGSPPHLLLLADGRVLCSYGYRRPPYGQRACVSTDGVTWRVEDEIVLRDDAPNGDLGYPASIELGAGQILTVYYQPDVSPRTTQQMHPPDPHRIKPGILGTIWTMPKHASTNNRTQDMTPTTHFPNVATTLTGFRNPPASHRSAPLWVWNDRMTPEIIDRDLAALHERGIGGVFIHPRPGLITPYLSEEWLALCAHAVRKAKRLGMEAWIYDENSYPSGFAGGLVPEQIPDAKRTGMKMTTCSLLPEIFDTPPLVVLKREAGGFREITGEIGTVKFGEGEYRCFTRIYEEPRPWHGGLTYVDLLRPDVTRAFIDITMGAYERAIGGEFGGTVPGVFQDEAEINPPQGQGPAITFTPALFDEFVRRRGYDLRPMLPSLFEESGDWRKVRHDYYATLLDLFTEGWGKQYYDYCTAKNLKLTGHYWEHEWPRPVLTPDNMACAAYAHIPGIDVLMNEFRLEPDAQFGNARSVKEIRSVANQLGRERTLSETYGASGWNLTFADQKRIADWQFALGVNLVNQHLTYVTIAGARKRDHPLSFSYHEPWWDHYRVLADYIGRLSVALTAGEQVNRILVLEPTTTGWMYSSPEGEQVRLAGIGTDFQNFVHLLEARQIEYDLGCEEILRNHGAANGKELVVGKRSYNLLIIPPGTENLEESTVALLESYLRGGGSVMSCVEPPPYIGGRRSGRLHTLAEEHRDAWTHTGAADLVGTIHRLSPPAIRFLDAAGSPANIPMIFHHRRILEDGELLFVANTGLAEFAGVAVVPGRSCESWDPFTGSVSPYPAIRTGENLRLLLTIPPGGSLLLHLKKGGEPAPVKAATKWSVIPPSGATLIREMDPNVLTLDYCDLSLNGRTEKDLYFYQAQQKAYQHHGIERNPWDNAVQLRTGILDQDRFDPRSGFSAVFRFTLGKGVNAGSLRAAVERPGIFRVRVNGAEIPPLPGQWWLDESFGLFDVSRSVRPGENTIEVVSAPFSIHSELEPVYLLGDFRLEGEARGFQVVPAREITLGPWNRQGLPLYAGRVRYEETFDLEGDQLQGRSFLVGLGPWSGSTATVEVNSREAGIIFTPPYELEITGLLQGGRNRIAVIVHGTLKNTLGPHHNEPQPGRAWPGQFQAGPKEGVAPGSEYSTIGYGLFERFTLRSGNR